MQTTNSKLKAAIDHHQRGQLEQAESLYRKVLAQAPDDAEALHLFGVLLQQSGRLSEAIDTLNRAVAAAAGVFRFNLGNALRAAARNDEAAQAYRTALDLQPDLVDARVNLANALLDQGEIQAAEGEYRQALRDDPRSVAAHINMADLLLTDGRLEEAEQLCRTALQIVPRLADAHNTLGNILRARGDTDAAHQAYMKALEIEPGFVQAFSNIGQVMLNQGKAAEAEDVYTRIIAALPNDHDAHAQLGIALAAQDKLSEARQSLLKAIELSPGSAQYHKELGNCSKDLGELDAAERSYREALRLQPALTVAYQHLSQITCYEQLSQPDIVAMEALLENRLSDNDRLSLHYALGKAYDDCGAYDQAFAQFAAANGISDPALPDNAAEFRLFADETIRRLDAGFFSNNQLKGSDSGLPVFIVGMPRSGTTLVEQMLASHPSVIGAGELGDIYRLIEEAATELGRNDVSWTAALTNNVLSRIAQEYLDLRRSGHPASILRVTDKMPDNYNYLGYVRLLFPSAHVIHCQRDPLDTCFSMYSTHLKFDYASELGKLGERYRHYQRMMAHWKALFPDWILDVRYEDMVSDPEAHARRMVEFVGLPWQPEVLEFHKSKRAVRTASSWQVRQPIYTRSLGRARHYRSHLGPLIEALEADAES